MSKSTGNHQDGSSKEPISDDQRQEMIQEVNELRKENDRLRADMEEDLLTYYRKLAGPSAEALINDKKEALKSIYSADPAVREVALHLAAFYWDMSDEISEFCEHLVHSESNERIRIIAIKVLGLSYSETKEMRIGRLLAAIVKDENCSADLRVAAYFALIQVDGRHNHSVRRHKLSMADIKWTFVESYL